MSYALITGASKGIGKEIAIELAKRKYNLILVARSEQNLKELSSELSAQYGIACHYRCVDLIKETEVTQLCSSVIKEFTDLTILVNNAGYGLWGGFMDETEKKWLDLMDINMRTPVILIHELLPVLKKQKQSYILNIASTAAYQAVPNLGIYAATKSFILLFSRALKYELRNSPVSVTCVSPGATDTNFMDAAGMTTPEMKKRAAKFNMDAATVARFAVKGMMSGKNEIIPGAVNQLSVFLQRLVPKAMTEKIAADLYKK